MAKIPRRPTAASIENAALHYLERFASSAANLRRVLLRRVERAARAYPDEAEALRESGTQAIEALLTRWRAAGLLDDATFAEGRVRSLRRAGGSTRAIRARLTARGVEGAIIDAALETGPATEPGAEPDWEAALVLARRRRLGRFRPPEARAAHRDKDLAALGRAGFSWEVARRVVEGEDEEE